MLRPLMIYKTGKDGHVITDAEGRGVLLGRLLPDGSIEGEHPMTDVEMEAAGHYRFHERERHELHQPEQREEDLAALAAQAARSEPAPESTPETPKPAKGKRGK